MPSGSSSTRSTICWGVWRVMTRPQFGQCGMPIRGVEQAQVVVDLGDRADGRARVAARRLLVDGDRGRQALDEIDVGLVHLAQELPRVAAQALDVATLAFRVDRVERQAALAAAGQTGDHDEPVARQVDVDVAQVVLARAADRDQVRLAGRDRLRCPGRDGGAGHGRRNPRRRRLLPGVGLRRALRGRLRGSLGGGLRGAGRRRGGGVGRGLLHRLLRGRTRRGRLRDLLRRLALRHARTLPARGPETNVCS